MTNPLSHGPIPVGDDDLQAYVDGCLPPDRVGMIQDYIAAHPGLAARLTRYVEQDATLRLALGAKFEEPIPARLRVAAIAARRRRRIAVPLTRAAAIAFIAVIGGAGGWAARSWHDRGDALRAASMNAVAAYDTFSVEIRHPVEVRAENGAQLVQWLSSRLRRPLTPPDLTRFGFRLMGGRVLPTANAPAAQLMYDDDHGLRITVYLQPMGVDGEDFRFTRRGDVRTIYWAERRLAMAVTGHTPRSRLADLAQSVRDQMNSAEAAGVRSP